MLSSSPLSPRSGLRKKSSLAQILRKEIEINKKTISKKTVLSPTPEIFKDSKIKEKLLNLSQKTKEKHIEPKEKSPQIQAPSLKDDSIDQSDESIKEEGYLEKLDLNDLKQSKAKNFLIYQKKQSALKKKSQGNKNPNGQDKDTLNPGLTAYNIWLNEKGNTPETETVNEKNIEFITYITNLTQNENLGKDSEIKEEMKENKKVIHIKTPDYFTFMRLEHEINEVIRKQKEFYELKKLYFEKKRGNSMDDSDEILKKKNMSPKKNNNEKEKQLNLKEKLNTKFDRKQKFR